MGLKTPLYIIVATLLLGVAVVVMWLPGNVPDWADEWHLQKSYACFGACTNLLAWPLSWLTGVTHLQAMRSIITFLNVPVDFNSPSMKVSPIELDGVPAKVFRPQPAPASSPAIIYLHGGGWTILTSEVYDKTCEHIASSYNTAVFSIDYRLAPEHPYPTPFEDCLKATIYILKNAGKLGIDPNHIAIAGDSAGGNLAAAVALRLSQKDLSTTLPRLRFQVLIYPALQMLDLNTYSYKNFSSYGSLTKPFMTEMWLAYLGYPELYPYADQFMSNQHSFELLKNSPQASYVKHKLLPEELQVPDFQPPHVESGNASLAAKVRSRILDPYFCPLMAKDVSKVPPAYFIMANIDLLRDDGFLYAQRLRKAGVKVEVDFYRALSHGFAAIAPKESMVYDGGLRAFKTLGKFVKDML